jgi:hypothetical protein
MPTQLDGLEERRRHLYFLTKNDKAIMLLSFIACEIIASLLFALPTFADAVALLGQY